MKTQEGPSTPGGFRRIVSSFGRDLRYGLRVLLKQPGFAIPAVLTLALGIGATTALFSVLHGVVLSPLPYRAPRELVMLWETHFSEGLDRERLSPVNFLDYRGLSSFFQDAAAWWQPQLNLADAAGEPIRVSAIEVSGNFFSVLGVSPAVGREFSSGLHGPEDEIVISHRFWQARYGGDSSMLGQSVRLNGQPHTIVGIMPAGFNFPGKTDLWQRLGWNLANHSRHAHFMEAVARLAPGVTPEQAERGLAALTTNLATEFPASNRGWGVRVTTLQQEVVGTFGPALLVLFGAVSFLLLLACTNVAGLLLARGAVREREIAVRAALGAGRGQLVSQILMESLVLGAAGTLLGLAFAFSSVTLLRAQTFIAIPRIDEVAINVPVLAFTVGVSLVVTVLFGLAPAFQLAHTPLQTTLREGTRGAGASRVRARRILVVGEVAFAVLLVVGAGLLIRSFARLAAEAPGFEPEQVASVNVELPSPPAAEWSRISQFYTSLLDGLRSHAPVVAAGATSFLPLDPAWRGVFDIKGRVTEPGKETEAQHVTVTPDFFKALRVPLLRGRLLAESDHAGSRGVVVVNRELVRRYWPNEEPVGQFIRVRMRGIGPLGRLLMESPELEIVGVVGDVKNATLRNDVEPAIYFSYLQFPYKNMHVTVRGAVSPAEVATWVREELKRLDPSIPVSEARSLERVLDDAVGEPRFVMFLMSAFAALALLLAAIGVYGVLSYTVSQRRQEIGIRMALGADPGRLLLRVLGEGMGLAMAGVLLGLVAATGLTRFMASLLFHVRPFDLDTFVAASAVVAAVAAIACFGPARRAAGTDPLRALRLE